MKENLKDSAGNIIEWPEKLHFDNCDIFTEDDEMNADVMSDTYIDGEGHNMLYRELVRRWNSHDKLLEACKAVDLGLVCLRLKDSPHCRKGDACCACQARQAIAAAKGS